MIHVYVEFSSFLLEPSTSRNLQYQSQFRKLFFIKKISFMKNWNTNLYRHQVVVMSVSLRHLQYQAGLLGHEGLVGDVGDGWEAADAGGVWQPGAWPPSNHISPCVWSLFRGWPDGGQTCKHTIWNKRWWWVGWLVVWNNHRNRFSLFDLFNLIFYILGEVFVICCTIY